MPSPVTPAAVKETINDVGAPLCGKFFNLLRRLPELFYQIILYERNEDGTLSEEFKLDVCALGCAGGSGGGGGTGGLTAPTGVSATDGTLGDRIRVTWNPVLAATSYQVWRGDSSSIDSADVLGTTSSTLFDDTSALPDVIYTYWVRALDGTNVSNFSASDTGYISTDLGAVSDLQASQGFYLGFGASQYVILVWTPVTGGQAYDIYRHTVNNFAAATKIDSDRVPFDNTNTHTSIGPSPQFVDNDGELVYYHQPPDNFVQYFFWVVPKRTTPTPAVGLNSNSADGWAVGFGDGVSPAGSGFILDDATTSTVVPAGMTRAWIVLFGSSGGGAGGSTSVGGGGGGGGAMAWGELAVSAGGVLQMVFTPNSTTGNAANSTNGVAGSITAVAYQPPAGAFTNKLQTSAPGGGVFATTGDGAGGAGGIAGSVGMTSVVLKNGRPGKPASGNRGGRGGAWFGSTRVPGAHYNGFAAFSSFNGNSDHGAGGSYASPSSIALATGGSGLLGRAVIVYKA